MSARSIIAALVLTVFAAILPAAARAASTPSATVTLAVGGYLPYYTASVSVLNGGHVIAVANVTNGAVSLAFPAPAGKTTFTVTGYDKAGAKGGVLAIGTVAVTVPAHGSVGAVVTLLALPAYIQYENSILGEAVVGQPASLALPYEVLDAYGGAVAGSAPFARPITLTSTDPVNGRISVAHLTNPQIPESVAYSGAPVHEIGVMSSIPAESNGGPGAQLPRPVLVPSYGHESVIHNFFAGTYDGASPNSGLAADSTGALWGTTSQGGAYCEPSDAPYSIGGCGVAFKLVPTGSGSFTETYVYSFDGITDSSQNSPLLAGRGGTMFGYSDTPSTRAGYIYAFVPNGSGYTKTTVYAFTGGANGSSPNGGLIADASGALYGVTELGGIGATAGSATGGNGTVYKLTPGKLGYTASILYRFGAVRGDGVSPFGRLTLDASGSLYGLTNGGGSYSGGTLFKLTPTKAGYVETTLCSFVRDFGPQDGIVVSRTGVIYAVTAANAGTVIALTPTSSGYVESTVYAFPAFEGPFGGACAFDGCYPSGGLIADAAGSLYGTTNEGGLNAGSSPNEYGYGVVYELVRNGSGFHEIVLHRFDQLLDGAQPLGTLLLGASGALYGVTQYNVGSGGCNFSYGEVSGCGSVFSVQPVVQPSLGRSAQWQRR